MAPSLGSSLLDHFAAPRDPRQSWKVVYPLPEVLLTVLSGTLAGAEDFVEIRRWALLHLDFLKWTPIFGLGAKVEIGRSVR